MTLTGLKTALDRAGEASCVSGTFQLTERLAIALPDGDLGAADDAAFVEWLLAHAEQAPFGAAKQTKVDPAVRNAQRLVARGAAKVGGFDPANVMDEVETALSPTRKLAAELTDVIVYPHHGKFAVHKDTPRSAELVGTLIVEVPSTHEGGAFQVDDGVTEHTFDWSGPANLRAMRWVALFTDVDHEVLPVTSGARVTLVYALTRTEVARTDAKVKARRDELLAACKHLADNDAWPVMIACTRQVIIEEQAFPKVSALRGLDRDLAEVLALAGYRVAVRACLLATPTYGGDQRLSAIQDLHTIMRLRKPMTKKVIAKLDDVLTFSENITSDDGDMDEPGDMSLAKYIDDGIEIPQWVIRARAEATLIHEADMFSDDGYFGNEAYEAYLYTLAALEVMPSGSAPPARPTAAEGDDEDEDDDDDDDDEPVAAPARAKPTFGSTLMLVEPAPKTKAKPRKAKPAVKAKPAKAKPKARRSPKAARVKPKAKPKKRR